MLSTAITTSITGKLPYSQSAIQKTAKINRDSLPNPHQQSFLEWGHRSRSVRQQSGALEQEAPTKENS